MDAKENLDLNPIEIADGIDWLGYTNNNVGLHCNPYLIQEGGEAVLIDGGSRDDFSFVMLKIRVVGSPATLWFTGVVGSIRKDDRTAYPVFLTATSTCRA